MAVRTLLDQPALTSAPAKIGVAPHFVLVSRFELDGSLLGLKTISDCPGVKWHDVSFHLTPWQLYLTLRVRQNISQRFRWEFECILARVFLTDNSAFQFGEKNLC